MNYLLLKNIHHLYSLNLFSWNLRHEDNGYYPVKDN